MPRRSSADQQFAYTRSVESYMRSIRPQRRKHHQIAAETGVPYGAALKAIEHLSDTASLCGNAVDGYYYPA